MEEGRGRGRKGKEGARKRKGEGGERAMEGKAFPFL